MLLIAVQPAVADAPCWISRAFHRVLVSMVAGQRWTVRDRYSNDIYLTEERWEHIIDLENHPETDHILLRITRHDKKAVSFVE